MIPTLPEVRLGEGRGNGSGDLPVCPSCPEMWLSTARDVDQECKGEYLAYG